MTANIRFTHFAPCENQKLVMFNIDECENCGGVCMKPNAIITNASPQKLLSIGLIASAYAPAEIEFDDDLGISVCSDCQ